MCLKNPDSILSSCFVLSVFAQPAFIAGACPIPLIHSVTHASTSIHVDVKWTKPCEVYMTEQNFIQSQSDAVVRAFAVCCVDPKGQRLKLRRRLTPDTGIMPLEFLFLYPHAPCRRA